MSEEKITSEPGLEPWYYRVGDRPVKMIRTTDGRMDVLALNWQTGEFERDLRYLFECLRPWSDAEPLTAEEFERYVGELRSRICCLPGSDT